jgi:hypothetical protein
VGVVTSRARSLRGGPSTNARVGACDGDGVTVTSRARQEEAEDGPASPQRLPLSVAAFLQRVLLPVPAPQTRGVRSSGLSQHPHAAALARWSAHGGQPPVGAPGPLDWQTVGAQRGDTHPERCPRCGQLLVCTGVIPRGGAPPPVPSAERAA